MGKDDGFPQWGDDVTLLPDVRANTMQKGRLYYYMGNFLMPMNIHGGEIARVRRAINKFCKEFTHEIRRDRDRKDFKTILEWFDEQEKEFSCNS
ncbi:MAG: hypothetical protein COA78_07145 [Blastopirellula sp.]|nr:MAG: hypothetical protein COA78_07145 [Blastopirellula sp.]